MKKISFIKLSLLALFLVYSCGLATAQTNEFTYQGNLTDTGTPQATYDFEFRLCALETDCTTPLETKQRLGVSVSNGNFTVKLDFAAAHFTGADRFLEISVRRNSGEAWTPLNPRKKITSSPYSIKSLNSATADNSLKLDGVAANQYVQTNDTRLSDARNPLPGSGNYIQANPAAQQTGTSFNIGGSGTLGGSLTANGVSASSITTTNIFVPSGSTSGINLFPDGGGVNVNGALYGSSLSRSFLNPGSLSLGGAFTTKVTISGGTMGQANYDDITLSNNTFVSGDLSVFGQLRPSSIDARLFGGTLLIGASALQTAAVSISRPTTISQPLTASGGISTNTLNVSGDAIVSGTLTLNNGFNIGGNVTAGGTLSGNIVNSETQYNINGNRILSAPTGTANLYAGFAAGNNPGTGTRNSAFGYYAGESTNSGGDNSFFGHFSGRNTVGSGNSFFGTSAGLNTTTASDNTFIGGNTGLGNVLGSNNTLLGAGANVGDNNLSFATAIGAGSVVSSNNTIVFGRNLDTVQIPGNLSVNGTFTGTVSNAITANNALQLGGVAANQYLTTTTANTSFIQNTTTQQTSSNFNISGNGTLGGTLSAGSLFVYPASGNGNLIFRNRANTNFSQVVFSDDANIYRGYIGYIGANAGLGTRNDTVEFGTNGKDLTFRPSETEVMRFKTSGRIGIGTNNPAFKLELIDSSNMGLRVQTNGANGIVASFGGNGIFNIDAPGEAGGRFTVFENGNVGIGVQNPAQKLDISGGGIVRSRINSDSNAGLALALNNQAKWSVATVTGGQFQIFNESNGQNALWITGNENLVGIGTTTPEARLDVRGAVVGLNVQTADPNGMIARFGSQGSFQIDSPTTIGGRFRVTNNGVVEINNPSGGVSNDTKLDVNGYIKTRLSFGGVLPMCQDPVGQLGVCSSSIRYKENANNFTPGLELVRRLRPVSFNWKQNGAADFGLIAEEVAEVEPLLATYNTKGEVEGVKYDRVGVLLINVVKEQQTQIERQQQQIDALRRLVCELKPEAAICKEEQK